MHSPMPSTHAPTPGAALRRALLLGLALGIGGAAVPYAGRAQPTLPARCSFRQDKRAEPATLRLGQELTITLEVRGQCPAADKLADVVLVVDQSTSMLEASPGGGTKLEAAQSAASAFLDAVDPALVQVGLIGFDGEARVLAPLSADFDAARAAVAGLGTGRGTNLVDALDLGMRTVMGPAARASAQPVLVFMTDGRHNPGGGGAPSLAAIGPLIDALRAGPILVHSIGLGPADDIDEDLLRRIAGDPSRYHHSPTGADLRATFLSLAGRVRATVLARSVVVVDELPADMAFVAGSDLPPGRWDPARRSLTWELLDLPTEGVLLTFRVRPLRAGLRPTNRAARADGVDGLGQPLILTFPLPRAQVLAPVYLPLALKQSCPKSMVDVALVLDLSSSMQQPLPGGGRKLDAAVAAARALLDQLRLPEDRVALVGFHGEAVLLGPLGSSRAALEASLDRPAGGQGTRIDLGLERARTSLGDAQAGRRRSIVILTDGRQTEGFEAGLMDAAARVHGGGIELYAVGLGEDADLAQLGQVAGRPDRTFFAPGREELADIYRRLAPVLPCE